MVFNRRSAIAFFGVVLMTVPALRAEDSARELQRQGVRLENQGKRDEALQKLRQAVSLDGNDASNYLALGMVALKAGNYDEARAALEKAGQLDPDSPSAHFHLAMLYEKARETNKAREEWKRLLQLPADAPTKEIAQRHLDRLGTP